MVVVQLFHIMKDVVDRDLPVTYIRTELTFSTGGFAGL